MRGGQFLDFMGGHRAHGGPPSPLPTRENSEAVVNTKCYQDSFFV